MSEYETIMEINHVTKHFCCGPKRQVTACRDLCLTVEKGRTLGIVGESGCGKSTLAKMLVGLERPSAGELCLHEEDISVWKGEELRQKRRAIQMVFQDPAGAFHPKMRIGDILTEPLLNYGEIKRSDKAAKAAELLHMVDLSADYISRYPHGLSGGQRQRVGISRALSLSPEILVCDESTSALDVSIQEKIVALLARLQREKGIAIVFICHDIALVQAFSHRVAVMYLGHVVELLDGEDMAVKAAHPYTKALLSSIFSLKTGISGQRRRLKGEPPSETPCGCPFHSRCEEAMDICKYEAPQFNRLKGEHKIACHLYDRHETECAV